MNTQRSQMCMRHWLVIACLITGLCAPLHAQEETGPLPPRPTYDFMKHLGQIKVEWLKEKLQLDKERGKKAAAHAKTLKKTGPQPGQTDAEHQADIDKAEGNEKDADAAAKEDQEHIDELSKPDAFDPFKNSNAKANAKYVMANVDRWIESLSKEIDDKEAHGKDAGKEKEQKKRYEEAEKGAKKDYPKLFE